MTNQKRVCSICQREFEGFGHNPWPVVEAVAERCCDICDEMTVLPARIRKWEEDCNYTKLEEEGKRLTLEAAKFGAIGRALGRAGAKNLMELFSDPKHEQAAGALADELHAIDLQHWSPNGEGN
jgi:hypothetical protein